MIRPKIMVVDDDSSITSMLDFLLRSRGYNVVIANDGRSAIAMACRHLPRLILLDYGLPDMNGLELLKRIRKYEDLVETPVIMITAYGERQLVCQSFAIRSG